MKSFEKKHLKENVTKLLDGLSWSSSIQFIECADGWASRYNEQKNNNANILIYFSKNPKNLNEKILFLTKELNKIINKSFNIIPLTWSWLYSSNRIPKRNTQDRFELYKSYQHVNPESLECWLSGQKTWGNTLKIETCLDSIMGDEHLFKMMVLSEFNWMRDNSIDFNTKSPWMKFWMSYTPLNDSESSYKYNLLLSESFLVESISDVEFYERHYMIYHNSLHKSDVISGEDLF